MISFSCKKCGQKLSVEDKHSGKRVKCPKCGSIGVVPDNSDKIKFQCDSCSQSIIVPQIHAGKKGKCPKCKNPVVVPSVKRESADGAETFSIVCSMCEEKIRVPETSRGQTIECPSCGGYMKASSGGVPAESAESPSGTDDDQYEEESQEPEEGTGMDRRLILVISGIAAVVVVGLIILVTVILPSGSRQIEEPAVPSLREVGDTDLRPQPVTFDTQPIKPIVQEPPQKDILPEKLISLEEQLYKQTKIAFTSGKFKTSDIYIMNADGSELKNLTNNPARNEIPCWSPNGTKIAFTSNRDGERNSEIYVMNADGSEPINLTNHPAKDYYPSWSPTGEKIAFYSLREGNPEIYIMNADGSEQTRLTNNTGMDWSLYPSWSPDGGKIAFILHRDGVREGEIYVMNADGSELQRLTNNSARDMYPSWSPDGTKIAFTSYRDGDGNPEIYIMNADGSEQTRLTNNPNWDLSPCWSPDGKKIAFSSNRDMSNEIYIMNADGSEVKRLTYLPASDTYPSWSPFLASRSRPQEEPESQRDRPEITDTDLRSQPVSSEQSASDRYLDLKLSLKQGQKHRLRLYREYNGTYTVSGQQHDSSSTLTTELEFEAEQIDANGIMSLKVTHLRFHEITKTAGGRSEYDSARPDTVGNSLFGSIFSAMIGRSFVVKVTPEGKIVELEGLAEMYQQMAEPLVEYEDEATRQKYAGMETEGSEEDVKRQIDRANQKYGSRAKRIEATREKLGEGPYSREENIRDMLDEVIMSFPGGPVGIGDSWMGAPLSMGDLELGDCTYTLRETSQTAVLVDTSLKIEVEDEVPARADGSRGSSRTTLAGSGQGSLEIDLNTGWMILKNMTLTYSGETKTAPTERNPGGTTTAQSMENITTVEPIK